MASVDRVAGTVRLSDLELAAATLLATQPESPRLKESKVAAEVDRLRQAGLVQDGTLDTGLATLVEVIAKPRLRVLLEIVTRDGLGGYAVWATPRLAVLASPVEGAPDLHEFSALEPFLLPLTLFGLARAGRRPVPHVQGSVSIKRVDLDAAFAAAEAADKEGVAKAVERAGIAEPWHGPLGRLLLERRWSWRLSAGWTDDKGKVHSGSLTIIDGGDAGLWRSDLPPGVDPADERLVLTLTPVTAASAWRSLIELLPGSRKGAAA